MAQNRALVIIVLTFFIGSAAALWVNNNFWNWDNLGTVMMGGILLLLGLFALTLGACLIIRRPSPLFLGINGLLFGFTMPTISLGATYLMSAAHLAVGTYLGYGIALLLTAGLIFWSRNQAVLGEH